MATFAHLAEARKRLTLADPGTMNHSLAPVLNHLSNHKNPFGNRDVQIPGYGVLAHITARTGYRASQF
jgi:hypothetical protein